MICDFLSLRSVTVMGSTNLVSKCHHSARVGGGGIWNIWVACQLVQCCRVSSLNYYGLPC